MDKKEIAHVLEEIAQLLEIKGENRFKIRAYYNGARVVESLPQAIAPFVKSKTLRKIKGIGEGLAIVITELVEKGTSNYHEELRASLPDGFLDLLQIQGLGPKRAKTLYDELEIENLGQLEYACQENRLINLEGFGEKLQTNVLEAIRHRNKTKGYFLVSRATQDGKALVTYLKKHKEIIRIEVAGSLRRHNEIVHDVDLIVSTKKPKLIHSAFTSYKEVDHVLAKGTTKSSVILKTGVQADLRTVSNQEFPYALYYMTGSKEHNVATRLIAKRKGLKISEYGVFRGKRLIKCKDEEAILKTLGLRYIPPELRENAGEIEAAMKGKLPKLVTTKDIKGIFHVHSTYSDGTATLEAMIKEVIALGYNYVGISDHSQTASYANGLKAARVTAQHRELDKLQKKFKTIQIFRGIESDILADGSLDYPDRVLKQFDFVIASIHSRFQMSEREMTERICHALQHPATTMLGHPTGRLLLGRAGYELNFDAIFETAKKHGVAMEINSNPHRLDLDWRMCQGAKAKGLKLCVNPDAHSLAGLKDVPFGVGIARKGWLEKEDVLNTMTTKEMESYLAKRKKGRGWGQSPTSPLAL